MRSTMQVTSVPNFLSQYPNLNNKFVEIAKRNKRRIRDLKAKGAKVKKDRESVAQMMKSYCEQQLPHAANANTSESHQGQQVEPAWENGSQTMDPITQVQSNRDPVISDTTEETELEELMGADDVAWGSQAASFWDREKGKTDKQRENRRLDGLQKTMEETRKEISSNRLDEHKEAFRQNKRKSDQAMRQLEKAKSKKAKLGQEAESAASKVGLELSSSDSENEAIEELLSAETGGNKGSETRRKKGGSSTAMESGRKEAGGEREVVPAHGWRVPEEELDDDDNELVAIKNWDYEKGGKPLAQVKYKSDGIMWVPVKTMWANEDEIEVHIPKWSRFCQANNVPDHVFKGINNKEAYKKHVKERAAAKGNKRKGKASGQKKMRNSKK